MKHEIRDKLPTSKGVYYTNNGMRLFDKGKWWELDTDGVWMTCIFVSSWFEEIELPTEGEINFKYPLNSNEPHKTTLNVGCRTGAKFILDKLEGGKNG